MRVLLVEDDARLAQLIQKGLAKERHVVDIAGDGVDALEMMAVNPYDVVVLDIGLPTMSGLAVLERLRQGGYQGGILMLTARDSVDDRVLGLASGADDYLVKPFSFAELAARLLALSRRPSQYRATDQPLEVHGLSLVPTAGECRWRGVPLPLTPKEFHVLEVLLRNAGRVVSREIILDRVWGSLHDPGTNVVDAVVARLRQKLKQVGAPPLIQTVRGFGYKVDRDRNPDGHASNSRT
jgi:two-component system OmpR family response regulator